MTHIDTILDHVTDIAAVGALAAMVMYGFTPSDMIVGAIVSIALGKKYLAGRAAK